MYTPRCTGEVRRGEGETHAITHALTNKARTLTSNTNISTGAHSGVTLPYFVKYPDHASTIQAWCLVETSVTVSGSTFTQPSRVSVTTYLVSQLQP